MELLSKQFNSLDLKKGVDVYARGDFKGKYYKKTVMIDEDSKIDIKIISQIPKKHLREDGRPQSVEVFLKVTTNENYRSPEGKAAWDRHVSAIEALRNFIHREVDPQAELPMGLQRNEGGGIWRFYTYILTDRAPEDVLRALQGHGLVERVE